jgi:hypothetical protein
MILQVAGRVVPGEEVSAGSEDLHFVVYGNAGASGPKEPSFRRSASAPEMSGREEEEEEEMNTDQEAWPPRWMRSAA